MTTAAFMRRGLFVARPTAASPSNRIVATTAAIELLNLGFIANPEQLQQLPVEELKQLIATAAQLIGADRTWVPMYPGFPEQVMNISDGAVFFNAITHYLTLRQWRPDEHSKLKTASPRVLALVTPDTLMLVNEWEKARALSEADREFVHDLAEYLDTDTAALFQAATFRNGENFATALWDVWYATGGNQDATLSAGLDSARNVDDVLRTVLTVFVDDSERARDLLCSAEHPVNITPIPRRHRVAIITALARFSNDFNLDLLAHRRHLWRRLMRRIHPFDVTGHQAAQHQLDVIHGNSNYRTLNSRIETALETSDVVEAVRLLEHTPGNFVRRLDHLMRLATSSRTKDWEKKARAIENTARKVLSNVSLTTLISAYNGLQNRDSRVVVTRVGGHSNKLRERVITKVDAKLLGNVTTALLDGMVARLATAPPPIAPVPVVGDAPVELVRRDASSGLRHASCGQHLPAQDRDITDVIRMFVPWFGNDIYPKLRHISRGERLPLPDKDTTDIIRMFVHGFGHDICLGVVFTDTHFQHIIGSLDYTNIIRNPMHDFVTHSGDITNASTQDGMREFIDITLRHKHNHILSWIGKNPDFIQKFPSARYAIMSIVSSNKGYNGELFADIDTVAGVMTRTHSMAGQVFEPRTVETAAHVTVRSISAIPLIVDLEQWELIWLDTSIGDQFGGCSSMGQQDVLKVAQAEMEATKNRLSVGELMRLWARAHNAKTIDKAADQAQERILLDAC